nr:sigma-70 family RNA polymerase sigma factor [Deinobacterium chartae]
MEDLSDSQLLKLARRDAAAFEALIRRHAPRVHALATSLVGAASADDVVQEVFFSVYRNLARFRFEAEFSTWLHRIALNACYNQLRRKQPEPISDLEPVLVSPLESPECLAERSQLRELIEAGMRGLPPEQREAFALREFSGLEYAQIAQITGAQLGTVKSRINRAKAALRSYLTARGVVPEGELHV